MPVETSERQITITGTEANTIFSQPVFFDENVTDTATILTTVTSRRKIAFLGKLEKVLKLFEKCGWNPKGSATFYERCVDVETVDAEIEFCVDEIRDTMLEEIVRAGGNVNDISNSAIADMIIERAQQAVRLDIQRLFWLGNRNNPDPNYGIVDGLFGFWLPTLVGQNLVPYFDLTSGTALNPGDGINFIRTVVDNSPDELDALDPSEKRLYVSKTIYKQYQEDLEQANGVSGGGDYSIMKLVDGTEVKTFRKIPIIVLRNLDRWYKQDFALSNQHRIFLTTPKNNLIATDMINDFTMVDIWYDRQDRKWKVRYQFKFGVNYIHESFMSVGY